MASSNPLALPAPHWVDLRLPDGTHSGVRVDLLRGLLEVQKRSGRHIFDLATIQLDQRGYARGETDDKGDRG